MAAMAPASVVSAAPANPAFAAAFSDELAPHLCGPLLASVLCGALLFIGHVLARLEKGERRGPGAPRVGVRCRVPRPTAVVRRSHFHPTETFRRSHV
jgi:hypothetical protein